MKNIKDLQAEERRLAILQLLERDQDYSINDTLIQRLLGQIGHGVSLDIVRADLAWLENVNVLATNDLPGCTVAILRSPGVDLAKGLATMPGIARPRPE